MFFIRKHLCFLNYWISLRQLITRKTRVRIPGQASKRNMKKRSISSAISSQQISDKNSESNKPDKKKFLKNLSFRVGPLMYKINAHYISGLRR